MEMRPVGILALAGVVLSLALLIPPAQKQILVAMSVIPLLLLIIGQFILPRSRRSIRVWFNPIVLEIGDELIPLFDEGAPMGRLSGRDLIYSSFKQWHDFEIVAHRFWLVAAIGLLSLGAIWASLQKHVGVSGTVSLFYYSAIGWSILTAISKRWVWERRMLRLNGIAMAPFSVRAEGRYKQIRYHFVDPEDVHRGGWFESMICNRSDDMTIIFYDQDNPDRS